MGPTTCCAANSISGGLDDDALYGGLGADVLSGGAGGDGFYFDTVTGPGSITRSPTSPLSAIPSSWTMPALGDWRWAPCPYRLSPLEPQQPTRPRGFSTTAPRATYSSMPTGQVPAPRFSSLLYRQVWHLRTRTSSSTDSGANGATGHIQRFIDHPRLDTSPARLGIVSSSDLPWPARASPR